LFIFSAIYLARHTIRAKIPCGIRDLGIQHGSIGTASSLSLHLRVSHFLNHPN
jgi:hypothetical protein